MGYFIVQNIRKFNNSREIIEYVQSENYDTVEKPGICFAIEHIRKNGTDEHEFKFMFND
jgi:hypothetical protein